MSGFGECPKCGKLTLIKDKRRTSPFSDLVYYVKCINCGFEQEYKRISRMEEDQEEEYKRMRRIDEEDVDDNW